MLPECYETIPLDWVGDWIGRRARLTPNREAVVDPESGQRWTYAELDDRANRVGTFLEQGLGLQKGDIIALMARNRVECIDLYFACGKTGVVLAPLSYRLQSPELNDLLQRLRPRVLFYEHAFQSLVDQLSLQELDALPIAVDDSAGPYAKAFMEPTAQPVNRPLAMNDLFLLVHTGGTTATPKICRITHRQMFWNSINLIITGSGAIGAHTRELVIFPFYHIGGWNTVTPVFHIGGCVVLMRQFDADKALEWIEQERITHFGGVEAVFQMLLESPRFDQTDLSSLQYVNSAGAPCSRKVMQAFWKRGIVFTQSYGLTEAGPSNFIHAVESGVDPEEIIAPNADSVGWPMFHTDYQLRDPASGAVIQDPDKPRELWFRNPHSFAGYHKDSERTRNVTDDQGWVRSGDLAVRNAQGYVRIIGRVDNMFISGGENISPEEVENALMRHPAVEAAAVVGVPDDRWGQVGFAAVVRRSDHPVSEEELRQFCRQQIAAFKVPRYIHFVDDLPRTGAGKIDRQALKRIADGVLQEKRAPGKS
ncbi:MAG: long-chain fatty acid--CoA ligase [Calditrichaeota bacterium]|nr:long-chain fatty acid--CoA ligase [Calditrichota bacterium]